MLKKQIFAVDNKKKDWQEQLKDSVKEHKRLVATWQDLKEEALNLREAIKGSEIPNFVRPSADKDGLEDLNFDKIDADGLTKALQERKAREKAQEEDYQNLEIVGNEILID